MFMTSSSKISTSLINFCWSFPKKNLFSKDGGGYTSILKLIKVQRNAQIRDGSRGQTF